MVLEKEGLASWHDNGGLMMSNAIGALALRRYHDPTLADFPDRRIALDIFTAGHDLIYLDGLSLEQDWETEKQAIKEIIGFFQERYGSDADFAVRVDDAVRRILRLKLRLYGDSYIPTANIDANSSNNANSTPTGAPTATLPVTLTTPVTASINITLPVVSLDRILIPESNLAIFTSEGRADALTLIGQAARESITLLYPDIASLSSALPAAPQAEDRLLIFSDSRLLRECDQCTAETALGPEEIAGIIDRLYGSAATGQVLADAVKSYTFSDLDQLLVSTSPPTAPDGAGATPPLTVTVAATPSATSASVLDPIETVTQTTESLDKNGKLEMAIANSTWIIFTILDVDPQSVPSSDVVKRFLSQRSDDIEDKKVIVLGLHAPYFLDATEISTLTAYFGVYGKTRPFLESAVRALFRSYTPTGAPPVSVPGTQFASLSERLQPDPDRPVELGIMAGDVELALQPEDGERPTAMVGDVIRIRVGLILDRNGRQVADGTLVNFELIYEGETVALNIEPAPVRNGVAIRELTLDRAGMLRVVANVGLASTGEPVELDVQSAPVADATLSVVTTSTITPTVPITGAVLSVETSSPANEPTVNDGDTPAAERESLVNLNTLVITLFTILITLCLLLIAQVQILPRQVLVHNMLWAAAFGLAAYILYALGLLPGVGILKERLNELGPAVVVFIAMLIPLLWLQLRTEQSQ
jgi:beta-N-acetylhexosaminidase